MLLSDTRFSPIPVSTVSNGASPTDSTATTDSPTATKEASPKFTTEDSQIRNAGENTVQHHSLETVRAATEMTVGSLLGQSVSIYQSESSQAKSQMQQKA